MTSEEYWVRFSGPLLRSLNCLPQARQRKRAVALGRALGPLRYRLRPALDTPHSRPPAVGPAIWPSRPSSARGGGATADKPRGRHRPCADDLGAAATATHTTSATAPPTTALRRAERRSTVPCWAVAFCACGATRHPECVRFLNPSRFRGGGAGRRLCARPSSDNYGTHKHPKVLAWLGGTRAGPSTSRPPRARGSTRSRPSSPSWPAAPQRGSFPRWSPCRRRSTASSTEHNGAPRPFVYTPTPTPSREGRRLGYLPSVDGAARAMSDA
jgi:hypothetical protein